MVNEPGPAIDFQNPLMIGLLTTNGIVIRRGNQRQFRHKGCCWLECRFHVSRRLVQKCNLSETNIMKAIGAWMIALGIFSILIGFVGLEFRILFILDAFGPVIGYALKLGLIAAGVWVWRRDQVRSDEMERAEEKEYAWIPVVVSVAVILGIITYVAFSMMHESRVERRIHRPAPAAVWASTPTNEWPALVLLQKAEFEHHTSLETGCACLIRLPGGEVVALTAGHLLGQAGGVSPGFLCSGLGGLDQNRLATLTEEITSWDLYLPGHEEKAVEVVGLFGRAVDFNTDCDQVLLQLSRRDTAYPVKPLDVRLTLVPSGEPLRVITYATNAAGNLQQVVYNARRVPGLLFTCWLDKPAHLNGCSGAPVVDKNGLLVGIVTGTARVDLETPAGTTRGFTGHLVSELMPVLKTALSGQRPARAQMAGKF